MVTIFTDTFKSLYYEHFMGSFTQYFYDIVIAERIEQGIKADRISKPTKKKGLLGRKTMLRWAMWKGDIRVKIITKHKATKARVIRPCLPKYLVLTLLSLFWQTNLPICQKTKMKTI
jgi:hypothetical protein